MAPVRRRRRTAGRGASPTPAPPPHDDNQRQPPTHRRPPTHPVETFDLDAILRGLPRAPRHRETEDAVATSWGDRFEQALEAMIEWLEDENSLWKMICVGLLMGVMLAFLRLLFI
ncbi:hypothetical protein V8F06_012279 [Rhypophila decipiens]